MVKTWSRYLAMLLIFILCMSMLPVSALAETSSEGSDSSPVFGDKLPDTADQGVDSEKPEGENFSVDTILKDDNESVVATDGLKDEPQSEEAPKSQEGSVSNVKKDSVDSYSYHLTDSASGVELSFNADAIPEGIDAESVTMRVEPITLSDDTLASLNSDGRKITYYVAYDITLIDGATSEPFDPVSPVHVVFPIQENDGGKLSVSHITEEGQIVSVENPEVVGNEVHFEAASFSPYIAAFSEEEPKLTYQYTVTWSADSSDFHKDAADSTHLIVHPMTILDKEAVSTTEVNKINLNLHLYRLNHKFCGILDFGHNSSGSYRTASGRNTRHPDNHTPVCVES